MKLKERFSKFTRDDYIVLIACTLIGLLGLYFAIGMSVSLGRGLTLFGASNSTQTDTVEVRGPTGNDILVLVLVWVLTAIVLGFSVFQAFFRRIERKPVVHKEIVNGKTVYLREEEKAEENETEETKE